MLCGAELEYLAQALEVTCTSCGKVEHGHIRCPHGHYTCDTCHNRDAMAVIEQVAHTTESHDPFEIADLMMSNPRLPMLGCQHAYIAGGAFMAALKNEGSRGVTNDDLDEVFKRTAKQAHGGYCGLSGVCGIAPAIGACFAVLTGSKCGTTDAQRTTMEAVTRVSRAITGLTGPSCCKAYVWSALDVAVDYLRERLGIILPTRAKVVCTYAHRHPHGCREAACPYFRGSEALDTTSWAEPVTMANADVLPGEDAVNERLEHLLKRSLELGAEKAKLIDTATVVVEEWVRWKCLYGCPLYGKDPCHPPCAPDAESTKKVMKEYRQAILLNSSKGKSLTEVAVKLEGEAYRAGYYKAFALTALSSGPEGVT
jgi:hypothetical protein